ncbi:hypothetical protein XENTR_v10002853 [Xenopus tropicalis]|nr:hypothetical protein XENTR_v10002853 [Xenopus tropicalis]
MGTLRNLLLFIFFIFFLILSSKFPTAAAGNKSENAVRDHIVNGTAEASQKDDDDDAYIDEDSTEATEIAEDPSNNNENSEERKIDPINAFLDKLVLKIQNRPRPVDEVICFELDEEQKTDNTDNIFADIMQDTTKLIIVIASILFAIIIIGVLVYFLVIRRLFNK